jgi:hypothetical protein
MLFELDIPLLVKNNFISFSGSDDKEASVHAESKRLSRLGYKSPCKVQVASWNPAQDPLFFVFLTIAIQACLQWAADVC